MKAPFGELTIFDLLGSVYASWCVSTIVIVFGSLDLMAGTHLAEAAPLSLLVLRLRLPLCVSRAVTSSFSVVLVIRFALCAKKKKRGDFRCSLCYKDTYISTSNKKYPCCDLTRNCKFHSPHPPLSATNLRICDQFSVPFCLQVPHHPLQSKFSLPGPLFCSSLAIDCTEGHYH